MECVYKGVLPAMPINQIQVDKEAVKVLVLQHGQREAARMAGLNENTVRSWAMRYGWSNQEVQPSRNHSVSDNVAATLASRKQQSRSLLSEYQVRAATEAAAHREPLKITRQVNDLASIHSKVWPEEQQQTAQFSLNVLNLNMFSDDSSPTLD